jgi:dolichol-phosphate mannosyltransferase
MKKIAIILPVFNEEKNLTKLVKILKKNLSTPFFKDYRLKLLFINDGSTDKSWTLIKKFSKLNKLFSGINLQKNYGKELIMEYGLEFVKNFDAVIFIDSDLQHPPSMIKKLILKWEASKKTISIVKGIKLNSSKIGFFKKFTSYLYFFLFGKYVLNSVYGESDFRIIDKKVVSQLLKYKNKSGLFRDHINSLGFNSSSIYFYPNERYAGKPSYSYFSLFKSTVDNVFINTGLPIRTIGFFGLFLILIFLLLFLFMLSSYLSGNVLIITPTTFFVVFNLILTGFLILILMIISIYLQRIHKKMFQNNQLISIEKINIRH